jgi:hypothetical protein
MHDDEEEDERRRIKREREKMEPSDRIHGSAPRLTVDGFPDQRCLQRTGRVVQMPIRVHPRVKAIILAIKKRDKVQSMVMLFELMLKAYLKEYGPIDDAELPTMEELAENMEKERDKRDG